MIRQYMNSNKLVDITDISQKLIDFNPQLFGIKKKSSPFKALNTILSIMHIEESLVSEPCQCLSHRYFSITTINSFSCKCKNIFKQANDEYFQKFTVTDLINELDFNYKADLILNTHNEFQLKQKSNLFKLKSFESVLKKQIMNKNCEKKCGKCRGGFKISNVALEKVPKVFTVQLKWGCKNPYRDEILQFLKCLPGMIDLNNLFEVNKKSQHALRGMIVKFNNRYVYIVRSNSNSWSIINDSYAKTMYTGEFYCVVLFLLKFKAKPVGLFYEETIEIQSPSIEFDSSLWLFYERKIYSKEIYYEKQFTFEEDEGYKWRCLYCNNHSNENFSSACQLCLNPRITRLEKWTCSDCHKLNPEDSLICHTCLHRRFQSELSKVLKTCDCPRNTEGQCKSCDHFEDCAYCDSPLYLGMSIKCANCKKKFIESHCSCDLLTTKPCCLICYKKLVNCEKCGNLNFPTEKNCNGCEALKSKLKNCKNCGKIGNNEICQDCEGIGKVSCVLCGKIVYPEVCFICPVCDQEFKDGYCEICDYDVEYDRFVCGDCRLKVKRCFACEIGIILENDANCHLCMTRVLY